MNNAHEFETKSASGLTYRVIFIGLILVIINSYWINLFIPFYGGILHSYMSLFSNTVFTLLVILLLNPLLARMHPHFALHGSEALAIYIMLIMVSTVGGAPHLSYLAYMLPHPFWFASSENDWSNLFLGHVPDWMTVKNPQVLRGFYEGDSSFWMSQVFNSWIVPLLTWSVFMLVLFFVLMCMNTILRKQFTDYERLTYPITWLPLEMGKNPSRFFANKLMWIGFGIAAGGGLLNGLSHLYPALPSLPIRALDNRITHLFLERPWNAVGTMLIALHPFAIGLSFFMPLDLAFSSLFFFFFGKAVLVLRSALGLQIDLYLDEQSEGAWIGLGLLALWVGRRHLKQVFAAAGRGKGHLDDSKEPMAYKWAIWGIIGGMIFLIIFAIKAGFSLWVFLLFIGIYFLMAISLTKVRAGLGPPMHEVIFKDPATTMVSALGTRTIGAKNLTLMSFLYWLNRVNTSHPMPNQLEAFRISEQAQLNSRKLTVVMLAALAVSIVTTWTVYFSHAYERGAGLAGGGIAWECFNRLQRWLNSPTEYNYPAIIAMGTGFGVTLILSALKLRFLWWPFHPIGYVIGTGRWGDLSFIWFPMLLCWALKLGILRYGGLQAYRRAIPFFAGLILGDYSMACLWGIIGWVLKRQMYQIWV
ncbi:MAG: hypothetical protein OXP71_06380 [Candidatus Poribacteria bacterium]|nr:hypothetical protein [Candidatus Poribacteria bacterium]